MSLLTIKYKVSILMRDGTFRSGMVTAKALAISLKQCRVTEVIHAPECLANFCGRNGSRRPYDKGDFYSCEVGVVKRIKNVTVLSAED